jgi:hypothetical protein
MSEKRPQYGDWFSYPYPKTPEQMKKLENRFVEFDRGLKEVGGAWVQTDPRFQLP